MDPTVFGLVFLAACAAYTWLWNAQGTPACHKTPDPMRDTLAMHILDWLQAREEDETGIHLPPSGTQISKGVEEATGIFFSDALVLITLDAMVRAQILRRHPDARPRRTGYSINHTTPGHGLPTPTASGPIPA